jgi:hypothetical protein
MVRPGGTLSSLLRHPSHELPPPDAAHLPHSPPRRPLHPSGPPHPQPHLPLPGSIERQQGALLHGEDTEEHGHPGVPCQALPPLHAHPLPPTHRGASPERWERPGVGRPAGQPPLCLALPVGEEAAAAVPGAQHAGEGGGTQGQPA